MIADKAAVVVNTVFSSPGKYKGCYVLAAGTLYSLELYADFLACVTISQGIAGLFGIDLADNFRRPYFAVSIKEFWRRWHISLSEWLRDYVYIPLGGNRKGNLFRYRNLIITFLLSGIWHGAAYRFLFWGFLHAFYQIAEGETAGAGERFFTLLRIPERSGLRRTLRRMAVFFEVMVAWIFFRADSLRTGLKMVWSLFTVPNVWVFFDDSLLQLGLGWKEWCILLLSAAALYFVSRLQEKGVDVRELISKKSVYTRWLLYLAAVIGMMLFGTYGFGYEAKDFIYGGF